MDFSIIEGTIVFLLDPTESTKNTLQPSDFSDFLKAPISVAQGITGDLILTSIRSQVEVLARKSRLEVKDMSGDEFASSVLPTAIVKAFQVLGGSIKVLGLNYQFEVPSSDIPAGTFLAQHFLSDSIEQVGESLTLMTLTFKSTVDGVNFQFQVQPRQSQPESLSIFLNVNITESANPEDSFSDLEWLKQRFEKGWEQTKAATISLLSRQNDN